ncbi:uncharacterized protein LOC111405284 isoform X2 [Olea europaea subsp. europaea]|uniref:Uncharacterized protein LOC111405284 isoform X2 n=1 Tax=Olea europaea subsp. europaea TaxID=158383 RepID=A0A8S0VG39_OLEEU|nr:uncharacterized protein LOC111405284 isoform X2 [Olea europaea subsp. europaea]
MDKKVDLINHCVAVLAATDKFDCLNQFVQLKCLPVLDEWLQDIHQGKINDANSFKDGDKSVKEFLLVLYRALDKLPVNLHALQTFYFINYMRIPSIYRSKYEINKWKNYK